MTHVTKLQRNTVNRRIKLTIPWIKASFIFTYYQSIKTDTIYGVYGPAPFYIGLLCALRHFLLRCLLHLVCYTSIAPVTSVHWAAGDEHLNIVHHQTFSSVQIVTWGEMLMSGQAAFLAILILSEREEVAAWAQQLPQY